MGLTGTVGARQPVPRLRVVDMARGAALAAMAVYHFSWDLGHFGFHGMDVAGDPGWRLFARLIAGSFLFLVGVSLVLAHGMAIRWRRFFRRLAIVVAAACAVTIATWFVFPGFFVRFGILHHIALASVLALPFLRRPLAVVIGAAVIASVLPVMATSATFAAPGFLWLGLSPAPPPAADYVPLFPWFGLVLAGVASARLVLANPPAVRLLAGGEPGLPGRLAIWAGRNSLLVYLLHQPVLFGLVYAAALVAPPPQRAVAVDPDTFLASCRSECGGRSGENDVCVSVCACTAKQIDARDLWPAVTESSDDVAGREAVREIVVACVTASDGATGQGEAGDVRAVRRP